MSSLLEKIEALRTQAEKEISSLKSEKDSFDLKVKYIGKKGLLTEILKEVGGLDPAIRPQIGQAANRFKTFLEQTVQDVLAEKQRQALENSLQNEKVDITLPGRFMTPGSFHPVQQVLQQIRTYFLRSGFDIYSGPEIETDFYNFEALAIPPDHPARDMQDTFYLSASSSKAPSRLLRTHTSPVQIRVMEKTQPPIRMIAPGVVYRKDSDITHTPMFHQVEGLVVDRGIRFSDLKGVLTHFLKDLFGQEVKLRFRASYFPFTEPSAEVDLSCISCRGKGCRICKQTGWLEVMGCGMVDPEVFRAVQYNSEIYTGFAFGMGIERIAMLQYGVDDLRLFFENDVRFLKQFS